MTKITELENVDVDTLKKGFCNWVDKFLSLYEEPLKSEMSDPDIRGRVFKIEGDDNSLKYSFRTEFNFEIGPYKEPLNDGTE